MADHQRRLPKLRDGIGHRESLAGAGDAHERLVFLAFAKAAHDRVDGLGLIALRLELADDLEIRHTVHYTTSERPRVEWQVQRIYRV